MPDVPPSRATCAARSLGRWLSPDRPVDDCRNPTVFLDESLMTSGATGVPDRVRCAPRRMRIFLVYANRIQPQIATYDVDGRTPIDHAPTSREAVAVVKQFMGRDPDSARFAVVAIVEPQDS
ncbi:hypothetical protein PBRA_002997 [Plasmodiophora brassicae]|uniref:Uncharacterized protein n=1 Tax=Plasmodiophora brassicae TaxID=37360 RepID=A0A0G4J6V1_PLABS|nr:hypothetical protein PBRA_002997 [Plasmodiophora brassicae]